MSVQYFPYCTSRWVQVTSPLIAGDCPHIYLYYNHNRLYKPHKYYIMFVW